MIKKQILTFKPSKTFLIKATFKEEKKLSFEKENYIYDNPIKEESLIYLGSKNELKINKIENAFLSIFLNKKRDYAIDIQSFLNNNIDEKQIIELFIYLWTSIYGKKLDLKTSKEKLNKTFLIVSKDIKNDFDEVIFIANQIAETKYLQNLPPNILDINTFIKTIKKIDSENKNIKLKLLSKIDLKKLNMNLILSVNQGSKQKVHVAILEYKGQPSSKEKITFVGKGITFDSGGYNLKTPGKYMLDMKFDMSGAAIALMLVDTISKLKIKKNVSCVIPLTDNMIDSLAQTPESIWTSMSGKSVEITNTDAEGRLILADSITYAAKELNSSLIISLATLTGTIIYALGTYTGVWSTCSNNWTLLEKSANNKKEKVWRMPLDELYLEGLDQNTFADTHSCSNTNRPDSNIAAIWLKQFALDKSFIHLDIAGAADKDSMGQAPMFKTLIEFVKNK